MSHLSDDLFEFVEAWLPRPPARILDVGCGDGASTTRLHAAGFDAVGLDPDAPRGERFVRTTLEAYRPTTPFDGAVAIRSLHHVHDLEDALDRLVAALLPGARLVLLEFAVEEISRRSVRWLEERGAAAELDLDFDDVIPLGELREALGRRFRPLHEQPAAYLARQVGREDLHAEEEGAIAAGELPAAGARLVYELG